MLLSTWLYKCSAAIDVFLNFDDIVSFLTNQIAEPNYNDATETEQLMLQGLIAFLLAICAHSWEPEESDKKLVFLTGVKF